jgi:hypothetical protein
MPMIPVVPTYLGLDPGSSGGIAALRGGAVRLAALDKLSAHDLWAWVREYGRGDLRPLHSAASSFAVLEKVGGYVGGAHARGSHMFTFGTSFGMLRMALVAASIPFEEVPPQKWQKEFGLRKTKGETDTSWKNRLKSRAQQLFPSEKITLATADALLMAEYCRRTRK